MTRWDPRVMALPAQHRAEAQRQLEADARRQRNAAALIVAALQEDPRQQGRRRPTDVAAPAERPASRPPQLVEPLQVDASYMRDEPGQLVISLAGRPPLENEADSVVHVSADGKRRWSPTAQVRADYRQTVAELAAVFAPIRRDHTVHHDLIVHRYWHKTGRRQQPDSGSLHIVVKGALDGLKDGGVLHDDRLVTEVYTVPVPAPYDLVLLTLRAGALWPAPHVTVPA